MLPIYEYADPASFLRDAWLERKSKNPRFSLRAWARHLGLEGHAPLHLMLSGKRAIPRKHIPRFAKTLGLSTKEGLYLETLVDLQRARRPEEKDYYLRRLSEISSKAPPRVFEVESFKCLGDPIHMILLEMVELPPGFRGGPGGTKWLQGRLRTKASLQEIEDALERLIALGLLREDETGALRKTERYIMAKSDVEDKGVQEYHKRVSRMAAESVSAQHILEREFNGYALNIKRSSLPRAKELIRDFFKAFIKEIEAPRESGDETYQFNVQFFGLTKPWSEK